jgi:hypothetical protein
MISDKEERRCRRQQQKKASDHKSGVAGTTYQGSDNHDTGDEVRLGLQRHTRVKEVAHNAFLGQLLPLRTRARRLATHNNKKKKKKEKEKKRKIVRVLS